MRICKVRAQLSTAFLTQRENDEIQQIQQDIWRESLLFTSK